MTNKNGGVPSKIGKRFRLAVETIKDLRLRNGKSKDRVAVYKITNLIVRHRHWPEIANEIANLPEEEVNKYGNGE